MARRFINPRVIDNSRWLARRNGNWVVLVQVATMWCRVKQEMHSYLFEVEETGEKFDVPAPLVWQSINEKAMIDIGPHNKELFLSTKF